jgi:hypothetical protein
VDPALGVAIVGGIATVMTAIIGFLGSNRAKRVDASIAIIGEVREWARQLQESEEACRKELSAVRKQLDELRLEVEALNLRLDG